MSFSSAPTRINFQKGMRALGFFLLGLNASTSHGFTPNFSGDVEGNGGDVIVCPQGKGGDWEGINVLDYFEAFDHRHLNFTPDLGEEHWGYRTKIEYVFDKLYRLDPIRVRAYRAEYREYFDDEGLAHALEEGTHLEDVPDSSQSSIPEGCSVEQIARQNQSTLPGQKKYRIDKEYWLQLNEDNKAILILHEIIYHEAIKEGHINSIKSRYFNAILSSTELASLNGDSYSNLVELLDLKLSPNVPIGEIDVLGAVVAGSDSTRLRGWKVALLSKQTGETQLATIDVTGLFRLNNVDRSHAYTIILLNPDYKARSVISHPSSTPRSIRQYFYIHESTLPQLVYNSEVSVFANTRGIEFTRDLASDGNSDGIPDGMAGVRLGLRADSSDLVERNPEMGCSSNSDIDIDGIPNCEDVDIDGDGVPNIFDADDDGDAIFDEFDKDSNGDSLDDVGTRGSDRYFRHTVDWVHATVETKYTSDGVEHFINFFAKVNELVNIPTVRILGSEHLLGDAKAKNNQGDWSSWDRTLSDDGSNNDHLENDLFYAKRIKLGARKYPVSGQSIFFEVRWESETPENTNTRHFPVTFELVPRKVESSFDENSHAVTLQGNPFGSNSFYWSYGVFNSLTDELVYWTRLQEGAERVVIIPNNATEPRILYYGYAIAKSLERVPGLATYQIQSSRDIIIDAMPIDRRRN